jgi:hypothetical protein
MSLIKASTATSYSQREGSLRPLGTHTHAYAGDQARVKLLIENRANRAWGGETGGRIFCTVSIAVCADPATVVIEERHPITSTILPSKLVLHDISFAAPSEPGEYLLSISLSITEGDKTRKLDLNTWVTELTILSHGKSTRAAEMYKRLLHLFNHSKESREQ